MENYYPALIDEYTFLKLQASRKKRQGRETSSGKIPLLKSLCRCGICGGSMVFVDKGCSRVNYVCNLAMKGEHDREVYNVNMLDLLTLEICKDAYLIESDKANNATQENNKLKLEADLVAEKENRVKLLEYCRRTQKESFFELLEESENKIDELEAKLDAFNNADVVLSADELASLSDIFTDDVRKDYLHPERLAIRINLYRFISAITLNRRFEPCSDAKTNFANCVDITWHFKNGQKRRLAMLPYEYTKTEGGGKGLYLPFVYMYGSKSLIKVEDGDHLLSDILTKLHKLDLTKCLYPSKGGYQWSQRTLECGKTYWVPLDEGVFLEPEALQFDFGGIHTERSTPLNYISLMYSHLWAEGEYTNDYPLSKFSDLARGFNFAESYDFYDTLRDNIFDQELYLSRDLLMS